MQNKTFRQLLIIINFTFAKIKIAKSGFFTYSQNINNANISQYTVLGLIANNHNDEYCLLSYVIVVNYVYLLLFFTILDTYGIQRVVFTDRSDNMVTCICYFAVYSTDTSCRVLLIQDDNSDIQFSGTFNRTSDTNIAEGNITGVTTGRYGLLAFDSSSNFTVIASFLRDIRIIGEPPSVMTTMATSITATSVSDTTTTQTSPCTLVLTLLIIILYPMMVALSIILTLF